MVVFKTKLLKQYRLACFDLDTLLIVIKATKWLEGWQMYCDHENYIAAPIQSAWRVEQMIRGVKIEQTVFQFGFSGHFEVGGLGSQLSGCLL